MTDTVDCTDPLLNLCGMLLFLVVSLYLSPVLTYMEHSYSDIVISNSLSKINVANTKYLL